MWGCWHEMLAINIKGGMSTHIAEGKLHCPHPEFPSQVEGMQEWHFQTNIMHGMERMQRRVAMEEVYARTTYKQK